jgi:hypothetical protein
MGSLSDYAENKLLDHFLNVAYTPVATVYLALCTADPTDAATGASMSETANAGAYARTAITFGAAASRSITQSGSVNFPRATATYGATIPFWTIVDSATYGSGNVLAHGAFSTPYAISNGNDISVASSQVVITVAAGSGASASNYLVLKLLDLMFRNQTFTKPATYMFLSNTVLSDTSVSNSDYTAVSGTGYARVQVNINGGASPAWNLASGGVSTNGGTITFPTPGSGGWTQLVAAGLIDSSSGSGNVLIYDSSNVVDQTPLQDQIVRVEAGAFSITFS